jgi:hypothetical protein
MHVLTELKVLDLESNQLKTLPAAIGFMTKLHTLNLYQNPMQVQQHTHTQTHTHTHIQQAVSREEALMLLVFVYMFPHATVHVLIARGAAGAAARGWAARAAQDVESGLQHPPGITGLERWYQNI